MADPAADAEHETFACLRRGNQLLWGYDTSQDAELQEVFNFVVSRGINLFDTADSYGEVAPPPGLIQRRS